MDLRERERRERKAFDGCLIGTPIPDDSLVITREDIDRYSRPFETKRLPIDLLFLTLGDVRGNNILDLGCGDGLWSTMLALVGARSTGVEISEIHADVAVRRARVNGMSDRVSILQASAHDLPFVSGTFDIVFGNMILHHLDSRNAGREIHRVLRGGGRGVFLEPVALSRTLRRIRETWPLTAVVKKSAVSPDEEPLSALQIECFTAPFSKIHVRENEMFSRLSRIIGEGKPYQLLSGVDRALFRALPILRRFARYAVIEVIK
jgi:SAM-dependent methyltransferase